MHRKGFVALAVILVIAILVLAGIWYFEIHEQTYTPVSSNPTSQTLTAPTGIGQPEGCMLLPSVGTTSLNQVPGYFPGDPDFRGGMICKFFINPNLPVFIFTFAGMPDNGLGNVDITEGTSSKVIQSIDVVDNGGEIYPGLIDPVGYNDILVPVDANFDGYLDLPILEECGATGNCQYNWYVYDSSTNQFIYSDFLSNLGTFLIDSSTREISATWNGSYCYGGSNTYKYNNATYTLIQAISSNCDNVSTTVTTYQLQNGKMQLINSTTTPNQ